ncbi:MAG: hypothetical protein Fur0023_17720 [Bacteroidia bacterium]
MKPYSIVFGLLLHFNIQAQVKIISKFLGNAKPDGKGELEVRITKAHINSFAKYQMEIAPGINVSELDVKGGNFSIEGNKAKVVWINLPTENEFVIKLKISFNNQASFPITLYQKFYYLENSIKKEVSAEPLVITSENTIYENIAEKNSVITDKSTEKNNTSVSDDDSKNKLADNSNQKPTTNLNIKTEEAKEKSIPTTAEKYTYKIQIAASSVKPNESEYSNLEKVEIVKHKGMYKVLIDKEFQSKEEALQYRGSVIQKGYTGAFLVKYLNGERVN